VSNVRQIELEIGAERDELKCLQLVGRKEEEDGGDNDKFCL
jgi:hypothetical protein